MKTVAMIGGGFSGTMTAVQPSAASSGTVTLNSAGSFTYTPANGFSSSIVTFAIGAFQRDVTPVRSEHPYDTHRS